MNYILENEFLTVAFTDKGGEIASIKSKKSGQEYLWQGSERYWTGRAPLMFPICGRLFEGRYIYNGKTYEMGGHGFLRHSVLSLYEKTEDKISFILNETEATLSQYPFKFQFVIEYILNKNTIEQIFKVKNTDEKLLPFSVGAHPAFNLPMDEGLEFSDYYIELQNETELQSIVWSKNNLWDGEKEFKAVNKKIPLSHAMFDNDSIFLKNLPESVTLKSDKTNRQIKISYKNMYYLGLWHTPKSDAPFICIEPWNGLPSHEGRLDDFESKDTFNFLEKGKEFSASLKIEISE